MVSLGELSSKREAFPLDVDVIVHWFCIPLPWQEAWAGGMYMGIGQGAWYMRYSLRLGLCQALEQAGIVSSAVAEHC